MTPALALAPGLVVVPTPAGALHAVTDPGQEPAEHVVRAVLRSAEPVRTDDLDLIGLSGLRSTEAALRAVAEAQERGWIEGRDEPVEIAVGPLGQALPELLAPLSDRRQAALIDDQGFPLASVGLDPDAETELSTLAAEIARLGQRRAAAATSALAASAAAGWALVDRHGASTVAFFPLRVGAEHFVLVVAGDPRLHHPTFVTLIAALSVRYDATVTAGSPPPTAPGGRSHA